MKTEYGAAGAPQSAEAARTGGSYAARMRAFQAWVYENCCKGRTMKTPVVRGRDIDVAWGEPRCFGGDLFPARAKDRKNPYSIAPSILITRITQTPKANMQEYLDSRQKVSRPKDLANTVTLNLIHTVYEPGERNEDEAESGDAHDAFETDETIDTGSLILGDWMEETAYALIGALSVAGMTVKPESVIIEPLTENGEVADRRPLYLGAVQVQLVGVARETAQYSASIRACLD